jgi:hypothetical protein
MRLSDNESPVGWSQRSNKLILLHVGLCGVGLDALCTTPSGNFGPSNLIGCIRIHGRVLTSSHGLALGPMPRSSWHQKLVRV